MSLPRILSLLFGSQPCSLSCSRHADYSVPSFRVASSPTATTTTVPFSATGPPVVSGVTGTDTDVSFENRKRAGADALGPQCRPGHAVGRARSASPVKDHRREESRVEREKVIRVEREREASRGEERDLELELELLRDGPDRSVHPRFALCSANLP